MLHAVVPDGKHFPLHFHRDAVMLWFLEPWPGASETCLLVRHGHASKKRALALALLSNRSRAEPVSGGEGM
jgi:hypothetical protein